MARTTVGLDIGHSGVRAVGISAETSPTVMAVGHAPVPPGSVNEGEVLDPESVAAAIKQAWRKSKLGKDVVLGISGRHVIVRQLDLPWLEDEAFRKALPYRVAGQLPVPVEDLVLDYVVLGEVEGVDRARMIRILLVAAMRQPVLRAVSAVEKAGLRAVGLDLAGLALLRLAGGQVTPAGVAEARVDIGAEVTTVVVQVDGTVRFVRMLAGEGGLKLTRALVERCGLTPDEAEGFKRRIGTTENPGSPAGRDARDDNARIIIDRVTDSTLAAIRSSLDYFLANAEEVEGLGQVVLTGGGAQLPGLAERFSDALEIPVLLADPMAGLTFSRKAGDVDPALYPSLAVAAGLGLAEVA